MNDRTVLAVAHAEPVDGATDADRVRVVLDRLITWQGSRTAPVNLDDVTATALALSREYRAAVIYDEHQAAQLAQQLRGAGVHAERFTFTASSVGVLATTLYTLLRSHRLALPDDRALLDELAHVRLRQNAAGTVRMDHDPARHDDRAVALGMAAWSLLSEHGTGPEFIALDDELLQAAAGPRRPIGRVFAGRYAVLPSTTDLGIGSWLDDIVGGEVDDEDSPW